VDVSSLGLVTAGGKVVWGKYAQITNNPGMLSFFVQLILENDGCVNALLLG
jgi:ribosome biogenesis protein NSA2